MKETEPFEWNLMAGFLSLASSLLMLHLLSLFVHSPKDVAPERATLALF